MPFVRNQGVRIYWRGQGMPEAAPVVLLHSIGTDMAIFDWVAPMLERDFRLLRIDFRGHGASDAPEGDYSLSLMARDVLAVMDAAAIGRAVICGVSLGAMVAMQLVQDAPERVSGLVLACTSPGMNPALWPERIASVRRSGMAPVAEGWVSRHFSDDFAKANPALTETALAGLEAMAPSGYIGSAAAIRDMDVLAGLARVAVPTTVIAGERDVATPYEGHGDRIVAAIPGAAVDFLPTAHLSCIEEPALFARSVAALAARCG